MLKRENPQWRWEKSHASLSWDRLESFARERDVNVRIERRKQDHAWICTVTNGVPAEVQTSGSPRAKP